MKIRSILAGAILLTLAACNSSRWEAVKAKNPGASDVNTEGQKTFVDYDAKDPAALELLKTIGGASLTPSEAEGFVTVQIALKESCEQFHQLIPVNMGVSNAVDAEVSNSKIADDKEGHGTVLSSCIGKDGSCDQVAILFRHNHEGKISETVITFTKNKYDRYSILPSQNGGVNVDEFQDFLSGRDASCQPKAKDTKIYYEE